MKFKFTDETNKFLKEKRKLLKRKVKLNFELTWYRTVLFKTKIKLRTFEYFPADNNLKNFRHQKNVSYVELMFLRLLTDEKCTISCKKWVGKNEFLILLISMINKFLLRNSK